MNIGQSTHKWRRAWSNREVALHNDTENTMNEIHEKQRRFKENENKNDAPT